MKIRRLLFTACAATGVVVVVVLACSAYWEHKATPFQNAPTLLVALQAFSRDQRASGRSLPAEVSLRELVLRGYLTTNDARAFQDIEVIFNTEADNHHPQMILARARMPDGQFVCLLADGSVQQFTASRLREALENPGQLTGAAEEGPPPRPETNRPSAVNGSRR